MARDKRLQVRLTDQEWDTLQAAATKRQVSMSEVVQDFIKTLPNLERTPFGNDDSETARVIQRKLAYAAGEGIKPTHLRLGLKAYRDLAYAVGLIFNRLVPTHYLGLPIILDFQSRDKIAVCQSVVDDYLWPFESLAVPVDPPTPTSEETHD